MVVRQLLSRLIQRLPGDFGGVYPTAETCSYGEYPYC